MRKHPLLTNKEPEKNLLVSLQKRSGRNATGRITIRHQGGGVKKLYRIVDFDEKKINIPGKVIAIEYDPYRTSFICLIEYQDGEKRYRIAAQNLKVGSEIICSEKAELKTGNRMMLKNISVGTLIHDIELISGQGGKMAKGAGAAAKVVAQEEKYSQIEMPSSEIRRVSNNCFASIGQVSFAEHKYIIVGNAGSMRLRGKRPAVRGTAMNPCDHPHGGGEGRQPIGLKHPKTPWGKPALGVKTRKKTRWTNRLILQRRK